MLSLGSDWVAVKLLAILLKKLPPGGGEYGTNHKAGHIKCQQGEIHSAPRLLKPPANATPRTVRSLPIGICREQSVEPALDLPG